MRPEKIWPLAVVAALVLTVAANAYLIYRASDTNGSAVEPNYYEKGVRWDSTLAAEARSDSLGWKVEVREARVTPSGPSLRLALRDRGGEPVLGASVSVVALHNLEIAHPLEASLTARPGGEYAGRVPFDRAGLWELRVDARQGARHFVADLRQDIR